MRTYTYMDVSVRQSKIRASGIKGPASGLCCAEEEKANNNNIDVDCWREILCMNSMNSCRDVCRECVNHFQTNIFWATV